MDTIILVIFATAMFAFVPGLVAHLIVYFGLRERHVPFSRLWSWMPGYLWRLCEQLPPTKDNVRLARIAKWSDIVWVLAFAVAAITGPLMSQVPP